jgi:hypothetical protein
VKELQLTLYEVFGYLLPGAVLTGGVSLIFWAAFFPQTAIDFDIKSVEVWGTFLVLSYVAGHVAQGIGNAVVSRFESAEDHAINTVLDPEIVAACKKKAKELTGADVEKVKPRWLYRLCDDAVIRSGKIGERDVYIYREGFYRGTFVGIVFVVLGFVLLAIRLLSLADDPDVPRSAFLSLPAVWCVIVATVDALLVGGFWDRGKTKFVAPLAALGVIAVGVAVWSLRFANWNATASIGRMELTGGRMLFLAALACVAAWFLWHRYWRFAEYRVTHAMFGFLTIKDEKKAEAPKQ